MRGWAPCATDKAGSPTCRNLEHFSAGRGFRVGDIEVMRFTIPHDAADPVGFTFRAEGVKIGFATDLGYMPTNVRDHLRGCSVFRVMESNHDVEMLRSGPYPWSVKQRVMSRVGHLSNDALAEFFSSDYDGGAEYVVLAHYCPNRMNFIPKWRGRRLNRRWAGAEGLWHQPCAVGNPNGSSRIHPVIALYEQVCVEPMVGKILAGWRYDISGLAPEMRGDYESHFADCEHCRSRQKIHRIIDISLIALASASGARFCWRLSPSAIFLSRATPSGWNWPRCRASPCLR